MAFPGIIAFINPRSGGGHGSKLYVKLCIILGKDHVFDLTQGGPEPGLRKFRKYVGLRVIACGGDGTVGWIHSCIDRIRFCEPPMVVPFPLGTGNDMSRVLGWGANYAGEAVVPILELIADGAPVKMDRWTVSSDPLESEDFELLHEKLVELKIDMTAPCAEDIENQINRDLVHTQSEDLARKRSASSSRKDSVSPLSASAPSGLSPHPNGVPATTNIGTNNTTDLDSSSSSSIGTKTPPPHWIGSSRKIRFHNSVDHLPIRKEMEEELPPTKIDQAVGAKANPDIKNEGGSEPPTTPQLTPPAKRLRSITGASSSQEGTMSTQSVLSTSSTPTLLSSEEVDPTAEDGSSPGRSDSQDTVDHSLVALDKHAKRKKKKKRSKPSVEILETANPQHEEAASHETYQKSALAPKVDICDLLELEANVDAAYAELEQTEKGKKRKKHKTTLLAPQPHPTNGPKRDELYRLRERLGDRLTRSDGAIALVKSSDGSDNAESQEEAILSRFSPNDLAESSSPPSSEMEKSEGVEPDRVSQSEGLSASPLRTVGRYSPSATRASLSSRDKLSAAYKKAAEAKTLVMNNYFSMGVDSMVALEFHYRREATPSLFPHHLINKAWYGIYGLKHAMMNLSRKPELKKVMRLELDGVEVVIPKGIEALVFLQIPSYSSGTNVWGDSSKCKGQRSPPTVGDGLFEVVGLKGVLHLGALQAGWSSGVRLGQANRAVIHTLAVLPAQCDGEPWLLPPSRTVVEFKNQSTMLFNIAKCPKQFRTVTGLPPPSMVDPMTQKQGQVVDESLENTSEPRKAASATMVSASELRNHVRARSSSTGLFKLHEDVPHKVRSARKLIVPQRTISADAQPATSIAE